MLEKKRIFMKKWDDDVLLTSTTFLSDHRTSNANI